MKHAIFHFLVSLFKVVASTQVYEFVEVKMAKYVYEIRYSLEEPGTDPTRIVDREKHEQLCASARIYALRRESVILRSNTVGNNVSILDGKMKPFAVHYSDNTWIERQLCLTCQTTPLVLLCSQECPSDEGPPNKQLNIIVQRSMLLNGDFRFHVEIADSVERVPDNLEYSPRLSRYRLLSKFERWEMCIAAKSSIPKEVTLIPGDAWTENFGFYRMTNLRGQQEITMTEAFPCNSSPKMCICASRRNLSSYSDAAFVRTIPVVFQRDEIDTRNQLTQPAEDNNANTRETSQDNTMTDRETIAQRDGSESNVVQTMPVLTQASGESTSNAREASQDDIITGRETITSKNSSDPSQVQTIPGAVSQQNEIDT